MILTADREELEVVLKKAKQATETKSALPILTNFLISAEDSLLTIRATDLENYLTVRIRAEVEREGKTCVNSKKITEIVRNLNSATVQFELKDNNLTIRGGRSVFKLPIADPDDFPEFMEPPEVSEYIGGEILLNGIDKVEYALAKEEGNIALQGLYISGYEDEIHFVGSDGHRLALFHPKGNLSSSLLLSRKSLKVLKQLVSGIENVGISISQDGSLAYFTSEEWQLGVRLLEGEFPNYMGVIPTSFSMEIKLDKNELKRILKRLSSIAEGNVLPLKMHFADNLLVLEVNDPDFGEGREEMDIEYTEEPYEISFNGKYILDAIDNFDTDEVIFKFTSPDTAALIESTDEEKDPYKCIIMPMRL